MADLAELRAALVAARAGEAEEAQKAKDAEDAPPSAAAPDGDPPSAGGAGAVERGSSGGPMEEYEVTGGGEGGTAAAAQGASGNARLKKKIAKKKPSTIASNYAEAIKVADDFTALLELLLAWLARSSRGLGRRATPTGSAATSGRAVVAPRAAPIVQQDWSDDDDDDAEAVGFKENGLKKKEGEGGGEGGGGSAPLRLRPLQHDGNEQGLSGGGREAVALVTQVLQLKSAKVINGPRQLLKIRRRKDCTARIHNAHTILAWRLCSEAK